MNFAMNFAVIDAGLVVKLLLLLLIGMGPKVALVPFLEKTKHLDAETQRAVGRRMVVTAVVTAIVLFATGWLLLLNDQHLDEKARDEFETHLEKVVDVSLLYEPTPTQSAEIGAGGEWDDARRQVAERCAALGITNIRTVQRVVRLVETIKPKLAHYDPEVLRAAIASLALFCWCRDNPDEAAAARLHREQNAVLFSPRALQRRGRGRRGRRRVPVERRAPCLRLHVARQVRLRADGGGPEGLFRQ